MLIGARRVTKAAPARRGPLAAILIWAWPFVAHAQPDYADRIPRPQADAAPSGAAARSGTSVQPATNAAVKPGIMVVLTEKEKRCRQTNGCEMTGVCAPCPH